MDRPAPKPHRWTLRARNEFRTHIWNRRVLGAVLAASPAILASASSLVVGIVIDEKLSMLVRQRDAIGAETTQLDQFTKDFESKELLRASFLVSLANAGAADTLKFTLDKLYRLNAAGSLRRIAATIDPATWQDRIAGYDALVASDYNDAGTVRKLTGVENDLVRDARRRLTSQQAASNRLSDRIDRLQARKSSVQMVLNGLMYVVTILVFFLKTAD